MASLILGCPWSLLTGHWVWSHPCLVSHCLWALSCPHQVRHCYGHCLAHAGLLGIVKDREVSRMTSGIPMAISYYCQFFAAGITHRAVVATGCWHCYCWHYFSWMFMALLLLAFHGIIIILGVAIGEWPFAILPQFVPCSVIFSACPLTFICQLKQGVGWIAYWPPVCLGMSLSS